MAELVTSLRVVDAAPVVAVKRCHKITFEAHPDINMRICQHDPRVRMRQHDPRVRVLSIRDRYFRSFSLNCLALIMASHKSANANYSLYYTVFLRNVYPINM